MLIGEKLPIDKDVDFRKLAEGYSFSGGDIKNVILNAARIAASENLNDNEKNVKMKHFIEAAELVKKGREFMQASILDQNGDEIKKYTSYIG